MMKKLVLSASLLFLPLSVNAQLSTEQGQRATTALPSSGADEENTVIHRILRRGTFAGKFRNIVKDSTMFVVTTQYKANKYGHVTHDCIFLVKGNLTLSQIVEGEYSADNVADMSCNTRYSGSL